MGIPGLMSFMDQNNGLLDRHRLHGGWLVIDGTTLIFRICVNMKNTFAFGGDFDQYARIVAHLFEELESRKITPIVVCGGGLHRKIWDTRIDISQKALENDNPQLAACIRPLAATEVFYSTLKKKGIKVYQCLSEKNLNAVELAKILKCPILSFDSDFFLHEVSYIPFMMKALASGITNKNYFNYCKIFRPEKLLEMFPGLNRDVLRLAVVLLDEESGVYDNFFRRLELPTEESNEKGYWRHERIRGIFQWLSKHSLDDAVKTILEELPETYHRKFTEFVEKMVNNPVVLANDTLINLGLENKCEQRMQLEGECNTQKKGIDNIEEIFTKLPPWFREEYNAADLPKYFIKLISQGNYIFTVLVENFDYPCAQSLSFHIVRVLHGLLVAKSKKFASKLTLIMREGREMILHTLTEPLKGTTTTLFPALKKLRNTDMKLRKSIIDDTLEVAEMDEIFEDVPIKWRLYLTVIHFWVKNSPEPKVNECHILAILISMLFNIIDDKIGYERSLRNFRDKYYQTWKGIQAKRRNSPPENSRISFDSLEEALRAVTNEDCLLAASYFISHFAPDQQDINKLHDFDITVVHVFTGFQSLCKYTLDLNRLLGQPYDKFSFSELFNGTLLYNLYKDLSKYESPYQYVNQTFELCPVFLTIVNLLHHKVVRGNIS